MEIKFPPLLPNFTHRVGPLSMPKAYQTRHGMFTVLAVFEHAKSAICCLKYLVVRVPDFPIQYMYMVVAPEL